MNNRIEMGTNRSGVKTSPIDVRRMTEATERFLPSSTGSSEELGRARGELSEESEPIGMMGPPLSISGAVKAIGKAITGKHPLVFMDKLGERLAFERSGVRLYQAALSKHDSFGSWSGGPTREALDEIREEELAHFHLLRDKIEALGGDPTMVTPSADLTDVTAMGLRQAIADPRTNLVQCLEVLLMAELVDHEGWSRLIELAADFDDALVEPFREASQAEERHLGLVRRWLESAPVTAADEGEATEDDDGEAEEVADEDVTEIPYDPGEPAPR